MEDRIERFGLLLRNRSDKDTMVDLLHQMPPAPTDRDRLSFMYIVYLAQLPAEERTKHGRWLDPCVRTIQGVPWIVREHVCKYVTSAGSWDPSFVADRLARCALFRSTPRSMFVDRCEHRFVNTVATWCRTDPFEQVPIAVLALVCMFVGRQQLDVIDSSRLLACAYCHVAMRTHCLCGNVKASSCFSGMCNTCCTGCRRHRKRRRNFAYRGLDGAVSGGRL